MKKPLATTALAAAVLLALTGCIQSMPAGGAQPVETTTTGATKVEVPKLVGLNSTAAIQKMVEAGLATNLLGTDYSPVSTLPSDNGGTVKVTKTDPAAGELVAEGSTVTIFLNTTEKAQVAAQERAKLATRYTFKCGPDRNTDAAGVHTLAEVWKSKKYTGSGCEILIDDSDPYDSESVIELNASEKAIADRIGPSDDILGTGGPASPFAEVLSDCSTKYEDGWEGQEPSDRVRVVAREAAAYCPKAPHIDQLRRVANKVPPGVIFGGKSVAGKQFQPGTYQLQIKPGDKVSDCYWEISAPQGGIIANDFVTLATEGPVVSVAEGQGFTSERCGTWKKIG